MPNLSVPKAVKLKERMQVSRIAKLRLSKHFRQFQCVLKRVFTTQPGNFLKVENCRDSAAGRH